MRIIAGIHRGHHVRTLRGLKLRPMSDQLRETLFNVLGSGVEGSTFLDGYAGSGAVGIEALSRGAREVVFVESHRPAVTLIRDNLKTLKISTGFRVIARELAVALEKLVSSADQFDYVFLAPPYFEIREYHHTLRYLGRSPLILPASLVIAEHSRHVELEESYGALARTRLIRHGDARLSLYRLRVV